MNPRATLMEILQRDLLGPWDGEAEVLDTTPRNRYLVGMLAPVAIDPELDERSGGQEERDGELVPSEATARGIQAPVEEQVEAAEGDASDSEDKSVSGALVHPSSMGVRCQVPLGTTALHVTARWGRYRSSGVFDAHGKRHTVWTREPVDAHLVVPLTLGHSQISIDQGRAAIDVEVVGEPDRLVVEVALLNLQKTGRNAPPKNWLFQAELVVAAPDGSAVFLPTRDPLAADDGETDEELKLLNLIYRDRLEYAVGRTCAVTTDEEPSKRRARRIATTWLPIADVVQTRAVGEAGVMLDMNELAEADPSALAAGLEPLLDGYDAWLDSQTASGAKLPLHLATVAADSVERARWTMSRLRKGLDMLTSADDLSLLGEDRERSRKALAAFRFMNRTMREQRIRTQLSLLRTAEPGLSVEDALSQVLTGPGAARWRPFQIAFILQQLPALVSPEEPIRSSDAAAAELLFFPTGGGKTEAYLGLAAFTFAIRRLHGALETEEGLLDGGGGVAVIMRYTLRLLTSQQFQRAAALMCAAELERRADPSTWGNEPFRIGLWVGTNVSPKHFEEARAQVDDAHADAGRVFGLTVLQVKRCPWCGTEVDPKRDVVADSVTRRVYVRCGDRLGECPFSAGGEVEEGLPLLTVDEEIYRHPPTFLLATVDKFARLAREGQAASLFGYVRERCSRHGYRHPDSVQKICGRAASHAAKGAGLLAHPASETTAVNRLRPPDLIIQDELHLITGALGTSVGLFEATVDTLCSWRGTDGVKIRPLVVASTATVRNAENQVRRLYGRSVSVFPPQVLDITDTYFSQEIPVDDDNPGRRYLGVCAHGIRLTLAEIRLAEVLLLAGQKLLDEHREAADPYMTLVGYFNATRELAGFRRYLDDDVTTRVSSPRDPRGFPRRTSSNLEIGELTARISSSDIAGTLDRLGVPFDPEQHSTAAKAKAALARKEAEKSGKKAKAGFATERPFDVVVATSMLQVGVDVPRLGLMLVVGQPKNTAEYIQASSRVGRDPAGHGPGLVVTLANWARPRDMAHFEQFEYYHRTFYRQVEALSVTPYSEASLERGLTGVLISAARVRDAVNAEQSLSPNVGARYVQPHHDLLDDLVDAVSARAGLSELDDEVVGRVRGKLLRRVDAWSVKSEKVALTYVKSTSKGEHTEPLLVSPEVTRDVGEAGLFKVANSMREVQPEINLLVHPARLAGGDVVDVPAWTFPESTEDGAS